MNRGRIISVAGAAVLALALVGGPIPSAGAQLGFFPQSSDITIPDSGNGTPYPSSNTVSAGCDVVTDVNLRLTLSHSRPDDVDILLVGPGGRNAIVMSDAGGTTPVVFAGFDLDDEASAGISSPPVDGESYQPTNNGGGDSWPGPAPSPSGGSALSVFDGINPNETWNLFAVDDQAGETGTIDDWSLFITSTRTSEICIPGAATSAGPAAPYPDTTTVSGLAGTITDVNLTLTGLSHTGPEEMDILLVGPGGQNATVMSDAGSYYPIDGTFTLDDEASGPAPDSTAMTPGSYQPANHTEAFDTDPFAPPAPTPSGGSALSVFDGTNPNGTWSLFVVEDTGSGPAGRINDWSLQITDAGFKPTFTATGGRVKEGKKATFKVGLSAAPLIPFGIPFATVPGSAKAGKDFTAAAGNLTFAPGETSKNVVVKTKNDPKDEKNEKFSLQFTTTAGNISATAKIKDNDK